MKIYRICAFAGGLMLLPALAWAQSAASPFEAAPWWMKEQVVAQTGYALMEAPANRADFSGTFRGVDKTVAGAQAKAMDQVRGLQQALAKLGRDKIRISTDFTMRALYREYRDRNGNMVEDQRGDRITGYEVTLRVDVDVLDLSQLESAYSLVMAATPVEAEEVAFRLEPGNELNARVDGIATRDARSRAVAAAAAAGGTLGAVRLIDPTGRACSSDMLARTPESVALSGGYYAPPPPPAASYSDEQVVVTGMRKSLKKEASATVDEIEAVAARNPFMQTPPIMRLSSTVCVVYSLN